jgi:hypothetical protein
MHISTRVDSTLPDGSYELVPQAEQTDAQLNQAEAAQDPTQYPETPATSQVEGKPRCITFMLKLLAPMFMYLCIRF